MDKKGDIGFLLLFFIVIGALLSVGLLIAVGVASVDYVMDIIAPEIASIGSVGSANLTEISTYSIDPLNTFIQNFTWLGGLVYMLAIIGLFGFAISFKVTMNKWFMGLFLLLAILLIIASIVMSNIYQDFYEDDDELATRLREQTLLSYLILHSPLIFTIVIMLSGIIVFSGLQMEEFT